jgi:predicted nucleic acid-binding protein
LTGRRTFIDTNVLIYSISVDEKESVKRELAIRLLESRQCCLSVQVLSEFHVQSTRATRAAPLSREIAAGLVRRWMRFEVQDNTVALLSDALDLQARYRFSYWDCAIIAAARSRGCDELASEDMRHGQTIDGVTIVNPFI